MEILHGLSECLQALGFFGGIGLIILAGNKAKIDKMRAEREIMQQSLAPRGMNAPADLQGLKEQISEMQNTSHQFDISFDAALSRLEERVNRMEAKAAAVPTPALSSAQAEEAQRIGRH